jgi:hypothetical protein
VRACNLAVKWGGTATGRPRKAESSRCSTQPLERLLDNLADLHSDPLGTTQWALGEGQVAPSYTLGMK